MTDGTDDAMSRPDERPTLVLVTGDLFLGSRIRGMAERSGYAAVTMPRPSRPLESHAGATTVRVVIDLTAPGLEMERLADWLGDAAASRTLAYAPHVRTDLLKAARAAGIGTVLVRSQLDESLPRWLASRD